MGMTINFNALTDSQRKEDFYAFISSAMVSRVDPVQPIDLDKLEITVTMNEQEVDLVRAWGLFTQFTGNLNREETPRNPGLATKLEALRNRMIAESSRLEQARAAQLTELRDEITERILDDVREAIGEAVNYHHVYDHLFEAFTVQNCVNVDREFSTLEEVNGILNELNGSIAR